ncbi:MAG TPA: hypothetical protein VNN77_00190 [candidate division Zixibacteria bacterium]|nr:hypothetical protein [candidate division Zixibacteria bacterium]
MDAAAPQDKELFRQLTLLSNEIIQTQQTIQRLDSLESRMRGAVEELLGEKQRLREQIGRLESTVRDAAAYAVDDAERERQSRESAEEQKNILVDRIRQLEQSLQTKEVTLAELEQHFSTRIEELTGQLKHRESLLQIRGEMLKELNATIASMNRLAVSLQRVPGMAPAEEKPVDGEPARDELKAVEERLSAEIEKLKAELREKELTIAAKSAEIEMIRENASARIQELQRGLENKKKKRSAVAFLSDIGPKRFL